MEELLEHLKQLEPFARAVIFIAEHAEEISGLEETLAQKRSELEAAEARLVEIQSLSEHAGSAAEQAKADVIEAKGKISALLVGAKADSKRLMDEAEAVAEKKGKDIAEGFKAEHAKLQRQIGEAREALAKVISDLAEKRQDHDAVQASIESLANRLKGKV